MQSIQQDDNDEMRTLLRNQRQADGKNFEDGMDSGYIPFCCYMEMTSIIG